MLSQISEKDLDAKVIIRDNKFVRLRGLLPHLGTKKPRKGLGRLRNLPRRNRISVLPL